MEEQKMIRFGIMGCAFIAIKVSRAIMAAPNATIYAVASRSLDKAKEFQSANNLSQQVKLYDSYDMLLDDPNVDAVYMPLPTSLHLQWALKAAHKKKHILLEKPTAVNVEELDSIIEACNQNKVQLMDGTMWMHHPRTPHMNAFLQNPDIFGELKMVHSNMTFAASGDFFDKNVRVKPDLDALGALGDIGWYCIRGILWANDFEMPQSVIAHPGAVFNGDGVITACGATLLWQNGKVATFYCSFHTNMSMDLFVHGSKGSLRLHDFPIPYQEGSASYFSSSDSKFKAMDTQWGPRPSEHIVTTELPQEALMVQEFSKMVKSIRDAGGNPDPHWPSIARKTQAVMNAVRTSIQEGLISVSL